MLPNTERLTTPYEQKLRSVLAELKGEGMRGVRIETIAERMGRRPTSSLRRRLNELKTENVVWPYTYNTERGGLGKAYWIVDEAEVQSGIGLPW